MFVWKYLAGDVEKEFDESTTATEFEPYDHRIIEKPVSYMETFVHMMKGCIGAGILAMPSAVQKVGFIPGSVGVVGIAAFAAYCIHLLIAAQYQLCKRQRVGYLSYPESMKVALEGGPNCTKFIAKVMPAIVDGFLITWQIGICCIYHVFFSTNVKQLVDQWTASDSYTIRMYICFTLVPLIFLNLTKNLSLMAPLSTTANFLILLGLLLVFFYLVEDDLDLNNIHMINDLYELPIFIGIVLFALEAVGVILALEHNMKKPKRFVGVCGLFNIAMLLMTTMYLLTGISGYVKYGDDIKDSITLNLPLEQKKAQASKLMIALAILLSYPLQMYVAYEIIWHKVRDKMTKKSAKTMVDFSLRLGLVIFVFLVSVAFPMLGPFISLFGALCLSTLGVILPGVIDFCVHWPDGYGFCMHRLFRSIIIMILGTVALTSGVYASVWEIIVNFS